MSEIIYRFIGDGSTAISDAPTEDITQAAWDALPRHVQKSIAHHSDLYERVAGASRPEPRQEPEPVADEPVEVAAEEEVEEPADRGSARRRK